MRYLLMFLPLFLCCESVDGKVVGKVSESNCFPEVYQLIGESAYGPAVKLLEGVIPSLRVPDQIGEAYFCLAYAHEKMGRPIKAIGYYLKASDHYKKPLCIGNTFENIGLIYKGYNQYDKAVFYFSKALLQDETDTKGRMKRLYHRAAAYRRSDRLYLAVDDLLEAEQIAHTLKLDTFRARIYNQLGLLYKFQGELGKAGGYYYEALQIGESADIYHNYGNLKKELGDTLAAESYLLKSIALSAGKSKVYSYMDLGELYHHWGKVTKAREYLMKAMEYYYAEAEVTFEQIRLFTLLAQISDDADLAADYRRQAISEYERFGATLLKSNELFFGAIAEQKIKNLEIKRDMRETAVDHMIVFAVLAILLMVVIVWLVLRIRRGIKDKRMRRTFKRLEDILYKD
ncbi:MAG: hypothetical protein AAGJ93_00850 [Bacteroidota bacterium]